MSLKKYYWDTLVFLFFFCVFTYIWYFVHTDLQLHANFVSLINEDKMALPANFMYYVLIDMLSLKNSSLLGFATIVTLSLASTFKYRITQNNFVREIKDVNTASIYALLLCLVMILPATIFIRWHYFHYCAVSPNVWHNSTVIFLMPFALLLFLKSMAVLQSFSVKKYTIVAVLIFLNVIAKPSFLFCFIPAFSIIIFNKHHFRPEGVKFYALVVLALILIYIQHTLIFTHADGNSIGIDMWGLHFAKWGDNIRNHIFFSLGTYVLGLVFPVFVLIKHFSRIIKQQELIYSFLLYFIGLGISISIVENGDRYTHGNFVWQGIVCSFVLHFSLVKFLLKEHILPLNNQQLFSNKNFKQPEVYLFAFQVISGVIYLSIVLFSRKYMNF